MEGGFSGADVSELIPYLSSIDSSVDTVVARFDSLLTVAQSIEAGVWVLVRVCIYGCEVVSMNLFAQLVPELFADFLMVGLVGFFAALALDFLHSALR